MYNRKDFATALVVTAPSPATTGNTLTVEAGKGVRFPAAPFMATAVRNGLIPTLDNAEKIIVTDVTGDTLTFSRGEDETNPQPIAAGWRITNSFFSEELDDIVHNGELMYDVRKFGALVNGTTDDTTAVQAAIDAAYAAGGGTVFFPAGTCRVTNLVGYPKITLRGVGFRTSIIRRHSTSNTSEPLIKFSGVPPTVGSNTISPYNLKVDYWRMWDLMLHNNDMNGDILHAFYSHRNECHQVQFWAARNGSAIKGVEFWDTRIDNCYFDFIGDDTHPVVNFINIATPNDNANGTVADYGFSYDNINQNFLNGCIFENCSGAHVKLDGASNGSTSLLNGIYIDQCKFESNQFTDPFIDTTSNSAYLFMNECYFTANNNRSGYVGGAKPLLRIGGGFSDLRAIHLNRIATAGTVTHGIEMTNTHSGHHFFTGIFANWNGENIPTRAIIYINSAHTSSRIIARNLVSVDGSGVKVTDNSNLAQNRDAMTVSATGATTITNTANSLDLSVINTANDSSLSVRAQGTTKAAYMNMYNVQGVFMAIAGWVNESVKWRIGRFGTANGIGFWVTNGATQILHLRDDLAARFFGGIQRKTNLYTANTALTVANSVVFCNVDGGSITLTLPDATTCVGHEFIIKKIGLTANTVTLATVSSQTIDSSASTLVSGNWARMTVISDGVNWSVIG